ncbi:MAG: hypothetical protein U0176_13235 [Bacteroidia bacterium]
MARIAKQGRKEDLAPRSPSAMANARAGIKAGEGLEAEALGRGKWGDKPVGQGAEPAKDAPKQDAGAQNPAPAPAPTPTISYETHLNSRDGGKVRTKVGVGEKVKFTGNLVGDWAATAGYAKAKLGSDIFEWTAPRRATSVDITLTVGKDIVTVNMTVVEPDAIECVRKDRMKFPAGFSAAGMHVWFHYKPYDVSFGRVEAGEKSGPATYITGYYRDNYADADLWHNSGDHFTRIQENNRDSAADTAANSTGEAPPYKWGQFHWVIPNRFRVVGETGDGKVFTKVTQGFFINATGGQSITKGEASVHRGINDA